MYIPADNVNCETIIKEEELAGERGIMAFPAFWSEAFNLCGSFATGILTISSMRISLYCLEFFLSVEAYPGCSKRAREWFDAITKPESEFNTIGCGGGRVMFY